MTNETVSKPQRFPDVIIQQSQEINVLIFTAYSAIIICIPFTNYPHTTHTVKHH